MIQVEEIISCEPILVTESEYGYCLHTGDLSSITGARGLNDDARNYVLEHDIPYINFNNERRSGISKIVDYPGPSAFVHPPPYGPMDLAPVEYVGNLAVGDGYEVANIPPLILPKSLSRLADQHPSNKYQNISHYSLPEIGQHADAETKGLQKWARSIRDSICNELNVGKAGELQHTLMTRYRVYGVLFYELSLVAAGNGNGKTTLERVGAALDQWSAHFKAVYLGYPEAGHAAVRLGHKEAVLEIAMATKHFRALASSVRSPGGGPSR